MEVGTPDVTILSGNADLLVMHAGSLIVVRLGLDTIKVKNQFGETELLHRG